MLNCKDYTQLIKRKLLDEITKLSSVPKLVVIQLGDNPSSNSYIKGKRKDCEDVGIDFELYKLEETVTNEYLANLIEELNNDSSVSGIIVQLPVPKHINVNMIQELINDGKDVDGFNKNSMFDPCTPKGAIDYLKYHNYKFEGKNATVVGRSEIVGKPLARMLLDLDCTVTVCHSKTDNDCMSIYMSGSDIVFTCIDKIEFFGPEYFDPWHDVIDFGLGVGEDGKLHGNLNKDAIAALKDYIKSNGEDQVLISGVGGTGLLTRIALVCNTVKAHQMLLGVSVPEWLK